MNVKNNTIDSGQLVTLQELGERSRHSLRTSEVNVGIRLADPEIVGLIVDRLVPKAVLDPGPVKVKFKTGTIVAPFDGDQWEFFQRKGPLGSDTMVDSGDLGPVAGRPVEVDIDVPTASLVDDDTSNASTTWEFQLVTYSGENGNPDNSNWIVAEIDRFAPETDKATGTEFKPEKVDFTNLPTGIIDDAWLEANQTLNLRVNIAYEFKRDDDEIEVYAGTSYGTGTSLGKQALTSDTVQIPSANLPKLDARYYIWYVLRDVVQNESEPALANLFNVSRVPPPVLKDCVIPKGTLPDVIDLKDLEDAVYVNVDRPDNGQDADRISLTISNGTLPISLGTQPLGALPSTLQFQAITSRLLALWDDATAAVPITAQYDFLRGTEPAVPSVVTNSALNFLYVGPENPGFPGVENPEMVNVEVKGESGTLNHITAADRLANVTISTPMVAGGNAWVPVGGEVARLWYNGVDVHNETLVAGAVTPLTFDMTPAIIDAAGPGEKQAWWTIEDLTVSPNVIKSLNTKVQVDPIQVVLPKPTVQLFNGFVSCRYLTRPDFELPVTVPIDATHMPTGTVVTLNSVGTTDAGGLVVIPGTDFTDTYTIDGSETGGVFVKNIKPYLTKLKPIQPPASAGLPNGHIKIWYSVDIAGVPNPSAEFLNEVSLLNTSNNYCDGTPTK